jgi:hypothetical protein
MIDYIEVCTEVKHGGRRERNYTYFTSKDLSEVTVNIPNKSTREIRVSHWEHNDIFNILLDKAHIKLSVDMSRKLVAVLYKAIEDIDNAESEPLPNGLTVVDPKN